MPSAAAIARRWIGLVAAAALAAHAFGMGLLGPRMAETASLRLATVVASHAVAADRGHAGHHAGHRAAGHAGHDATGPGGDPHEKHPPACEACPLGQSGMALAPPAVVPVIGSLVHLERPVQRRRVLRVAAWRHRTPPARAPPGRAAA